MTVAPLRISPPDASIISLNLTPKCLGRHRDASVAQYLQEEELLCDLLDELLGHILWEELGSELKLQRILLLHILLGHLERTPTHNVSSVTPHPLRYVSLQYVNT